ncbi:MAG: hypothetical protein ACP5HM_11035 [Anaerolineae bacterium]
MIYHLYRDAFSEVYTYRYRLTTEDETPLLQATWPTIHATRQPEQVNFEDAAGQRLAQLQWYDRGWWRGDLFELRDVSENLIAAFEERWNIVDRLLLHLPRYRIALPDGNLLETRGSRYAEQFYEIFVLPASSYKETKAITTASVTEEEGVWLGEILHPPLGPTYIFKTNSPLLTATPTLAMAIMIVIDLWGFDKAKHA